jgi:hypothetical protein
VSTVKEDCPTISRAMPKRAMLIFTRFQLAVTNRQLAGDNQQLS